MWRLKSVEDARMSLVYIRSFRNTVVMAVEAYSLNPQVALRLFG